MNEPEQQFVEFKKIARLSRPIIITEKLDGTNGQILITDTGDIFVGSRNRFLSKDNDNFGFYSWVMSNKDEVLKLGPGRHFGEFWGRGINRGYNLTEKRFSLFNVGKWNSDNIPKCFHVVPTLYTGNFDTVAIEETINFLRTNGSVASPGFNNPEGVIIFHVASGTLFKKTLINDEKPKGA